ncbi:MAG: rhomboid family intramembrane serine protease, partial [Solirubrobacterales bacterium]|nr:rhomboid family intramembrane serine protease [Solirubrobacterales bacterium]
MFPLKDNMPTDRFPVVTVALIVANVLMYFLFQKAGIFNGPDDLNVVEYGAIPYEISNPGRECEMVGERIGCEGQPGINGEADPQAPTWLTVFTSMFMHGSILHIAGNMLFLWIFGNNIEDSMGRVRFLLFYLLGGIAALAAQVAVGADAAVPTVGASGAVSAVLGGYLLLYPRARVVTVIFLVFFFTVIELPALLVLGFWIVQQLAFGYFDLAT